MTEKFLIEQQNEITSSLIYKKLSRIVRDPENARILARISEDEARHYQLLRAMTQVDIRPNRWKAGFFFFISRVFGLTFGIKLLERGESDAVSAYSQFSQEHPHLDSLIRDESAHEEQLIGMIAEERLDYIGSVVLGLNDALVELTGALAGFTFAFQNTRLIAVTGLITGISASFSMSASEYLSTLQESGNREKSIKSALYTGAAYVLTVAALILPYLLLANPFVSLAFCLATAILIIFVFNYYISVAKGTPLRKRFWEMALISLGVSGISFLIGILVKNLFGLEI
jgi:VIT1/CCC1 family predicted Fe2+/Mn2+ transporter